MTIESVDPIEPVETVDVVETPEVPAVETPVEKPAAKPTMEDSIRAKFRELTKVAETVPKVADPLKPAGDRARDPVTGKFVETPEEKAAAAKAAKPLTEKAPLVAPVEKPAVAADQRLAKAPTSWKGPAQAKWATLDPEIQAEVHRREEDFHKGIQQYRGKADTFDLLDAEIRPYEAMIRSANTNPQTAIRDFFNTAYILKTGSPESKVQTWLEIAKKYDVDVSLLPGVQEKLASGQPIIAPEVATLQQQVGQLRGTLESQQAALAAERQRIEQQEFAQIEVERDAFAADPKNEHFSIPAVKDYMAALIANGQAKDFSDAYNKAIWAVPEVREKLIAQQREVERKQAAEKVAAAKKAASTNVAPRGTPPASQAQVVGTMEDTIRQTYRKLQSGS